jgi:pyridoxamine 5'-phosphate oxidase
MNLKSSGPNQEGAQSVADLREDYRHAQLNEDQVDRDPITQFSHWLDEALAAQLREVNAMTLATVDTTGRPSARIVLLKGFDTRGFCFYTNYDSRKGRELNTANADQRYAALVFHWIELERQVRIEGRVTKVSEAESDTYFQSRPLASRIGAWASPQSQIIGSRMIIEQREQLYKSTLGANPARPAHWGGYRVVPDMIEFWQGRPSRLHDRLRYRLDQAAAAPAWVIERLAP